ACGGEEDHCAVCSPAADCIDNACACPGNFMPATPTFSSVLVRKDVVQLPGLTTAAGLVSRDDKLDGILVAYAPATVPVGVDIVPATASPEVVRVGFGYEIVALTSIRGGYLATAGTLHLTRVCTDGVAGVLHDVATIEVDVFADFTPVDHGCSLAIPSVAF